MLLERLNISYDQLAAFCTRNGIVRLAVFGSVLRDDFTPDSDIDVLVEFEPGTQLSWDFFLLQDELVQLTGRTIDLLTPNSIAPRLRDRILASAQDIYVAA